MASRKKLSTTIAADNFTYLHRLVKTGKADSVAAAVDLAVERARRLDNRVRLSRATAAYFQTLSSEEREEEAALEAALNATIAEVDLDQP